MTSRNKSLIPVVQFFHDKSDPTDPMTEETIRTAEEPPEERARRRSIGQEQSRHPEPRRAPGRDETRGDPDRRPDELTVDFLRCERSLRPAQEIVLRVEVQDQNPGRTTMTSRRRPDDTEIKKTRKRLRKPA